ncbi:ER membrane protein complex subunit 8 [Linnemannia elongata]|nr:ER membrane protein complex subunit 8 [Linnemannia elongata]
MKFSHKAYLKPLAHATKYPTGPVNGVFLAETNSANVIDAVPFFHFWGALTPMLEVAMTQVDLHCKANGLRIIGYYEANERLEDEAFSLVGQKIASQIHHVNPEAFAVVIKNNKINSDEVAFLVITFLEQSSAPGHPYQFKEGQWRMSKDAFTDKNAGFSLENSSSPTVVAKALRGGLSEKLADFDNHLENIKEDWLTNKAIV